MHKPTDIEIDLLCTEPVVFFFSLWIAFAWAVLFIAFSAIPLVFTTNHSFNVEQDGAVFAGMVVPERIITNAYARFI